MIAQPTTITSKRVKTGFLFFSLSFITYGAIVGGNVYQLIAEIPNWAGDIPVSLINYRNFFHNSHAGYFFQTLVPLTILALIVSTILLWNRPPEANRWILSSLIGIILAEAFTGIYFMPRNFILFLDPIEGIPVEKLIRAGNEWQWANYIRLVIVMITMLLFLKTYRLLACRLMK